MTGFSTNSPGILQKRIILAAAAILMLWGIASAWPPWPPIWGAPEVMDRAVPAVESYSIPFDPSQTDPEWYVQTALGLSAQEATGLDLYREPDGAGGWIETQVEDEVTATWEYSVDGQPVTQVTGPCVLLAVCVWDDPWDPEDPSPEAQARNDPATQDAVTVNIIDQ